MNNDRLVELLGDKKERKRLKAVKKLSAKEDCSTYSQSKTNTYYSFRVDPTGGDMTPSMRAYQAKKFSLPLVSLSDYCRLGSAKEFSKAAEAFGCVYYCGVEVPATVSGEKTRMTAVGISRKNVKAFDGELSVFREYADGELSTEELPPDGKAFAKLCEEYGALCFVIRENGESVDKAIEKAKAAGARGVATDPENADEAKLSEEVETIEDAGLLVLPRTLVETARRKTDFELKDPILAEKLATYSLAVVGHEMAASLNPSDGLFSPSQIEKTPDLSARVRIFSKIKNYSLSFRPNAERTESQPSV